MTSNSIYNKNTIEIKVLAIGNSFSVDALTYLRAIAKCGDVNIKIGNLVIGGCSLKTHWENASLNAKVYSYEIHDENEKNIENYSIKEALESEKWDYITFQQVSNYSGKPETYLPYINNLNQYVKKYVPKAERLLHQTWAYEKDSEHDAFRLYNNDQEKMFHEIKYANKKIAQSLNLRIIPSGQAIQNARKSQIFDYEQTKKSLCRDGYHADLTYGRYLLGATWYEILTGKSIFENTFTLPEISDDELVILKQAAHDAARDYK